MIMRITQDERVAKRILDALNDYTLDTRMIGYYIFRIAPMDLFLKLQEIMEGIDEAIEAENTRERKKIERANQHPTF
jgi:hypothetical protein